MAIDPIIRRDWKFGPLASAMALALTMGPGCGGESGPPRLPVSGRVTLDGQPQPIKIDQVFGSRYVVVQAEQGSGRVEVAWRDGPSIEN